KDRIHSYLTYLRDRLTVAKALLAESGSIFVQIGDENVHRVRALMDEVFGEDNFVSLISIQTTTGFEASYLGNMSDFVIWYAKDKSRGKSRPPLYRKQFRIGEGNARWLMFDDLSYRGVSSAERRGDAHIPNRATPYKPDNIISQGRAKEPQPFPFLGRSYDSWNKNSHWKASYPDGMMRLARASRIHVARDSIQYVRFHSDFDAAVHGNIWTDTGTGNFTDDKVYVVQTNSKVVERCVLMTTDPGDLVLDPTCGSGTTARVAEQWGRRWITIDTSRVALALARSRIMGGRHPYYTLADSPEGQHAEARLGGTEPKSSPTYGDIRQGFVNERVPHITLKAIANNSEIDTIWERRQPAVEFALAELNELLAEHPTPFPVTRGARKGQTVDFTVPMETIELPNGDPAPANGLLEWEVPREAPGDWPSSSRPALAAFWEARIARQREIDASIVRTADFEHLYDKPVEDKSRVRVAGPFTVESLAPHRTLAVDEQDELIPQAAETRAPYGSGQYGDFSSIILENLRAAGVQQAHRQ
ncbi:MAG: site-specific DNA-methyltransferase, partial [Chloroflexi bacterium]|nr:site-specific DNA-methyltransferase [Chloroflexota bacterium]